MRKRFSLGVLLLLSLFAAPAGATVLRRASLEELTQASALVVHAMVRQVNDEVAKTARGPYRTQIDLEILESLKGTSERTLRLDFLGGRGFGRVMLVPGMPRFQEGDEVVLLLERTPSGGLALTGLSQGVYFVRRDGADNELVRDPGAVHFVGKQGIETEPRRLEELLARLRKIVGGAR